VLWLASLDPELSLASSRLTAEPRAVEILLEGGLLLAGGLSLGPAQRLGDYLESAGPFIALRDSVVVRGGRPAEPLDLHLRDIALHQDVIQSAWEADSRQGAVLTSAEPQDAMSPDFDPAANSHSSDFDLAANGHSSDFDPAANGHSSDFDLVANGHSSEYDFATNGHASDGDVAASDVHLTDLFPDAGDDDLGEPMPGLEMDLGLGADSFDDESVLDPDDSVMSILESGSDASGDAADEDHDELDRPTGEAIAITPGWI
jgi:hypothetical protein